MKRILLLGDAGSSHLTKWVCALHRAHFEIAVFSLTEAAQEIQNLPGLTIQIFTIDKEKFSGSLFSKFGYLKAVSPLKKLIREFQPDILHAHYASSYGLIAARTNFHPLIISTWGSDVFSFGNNALGKAILKYNFKKADRILSTSYVMREQTQLFTKKKIDITPFGVDTNVFLPARQVAPFFPEYSFIFGQVKSMETIYGVDILIRAFYLLLLKGYDQIRLLLVGSGSKMNEYETLCIELHIQHFVHFAGRINHAGIPQYNQYIDVLVNPSKMESFGVSVLEAMASGKPVIVSSVGGLKEIVKNGETGLYTNPDSAQELADKMELLLQNDELRQRLGNNARNEVLDKYSWKKSIEIMVDIYHQVINKTNE